ncbi:NUDIX domain-containing protein [Patescibacteria group bacterium]|jgi:8-oxo-dGTP pyrophosphatase MutT (NUDIX family)|nr:NUDIX domain-containing protein [Patescibacteria group bacterium]
MAYYTKVGLLVLSADRRSFLVVAKAPEHVTSDYLMPGGKLEEASDEECLEREIAEELGCGVDLTSLEWIGSFTDVAAGRPDRTVEIRLYQGELIGEPTPSGEIVELQWISARDRTDRRISPIVRKQIMPTLIERGILRT